MSDYSEILKQSVKEYGLQETPENIARVRLIWNAWPGVAKQVGKYNPKNPSVALAFRKSLSDKTTIPTSFISIIVSAIYDLGEVGELDQKDINPNGFAATKTANEEAVKATGGSILDKLLSPVEAVKENATLIKWTVVGVVVVAGLWVGLPYLKAGSAAVKTVAGKFKRKQNPDENEVNE